MATLKNIGTKIKTTKNIAKITNALEVVATIKLQKIKKDTEAFKKYVLSVLNVALEVFSSSKHTGPAKSGKVLHIVIGSDKGLCGPINTKLCKEVLQYIDGHPGGEIEVITVGKKVKTFFSKLPYPIIQTVTISDAITHDEMEILHVLLDQALEHKKYSSIIVHFTYFKNTLKQIPTALLVYPFTQQAFMEFMTSIEITPQDIKPSVNTTYEPSHKAVRKKLLYMMSDIMMHGAILHHKTSEFAARMLAMKASKDNATQIIQDLTVQYNKIRQDTITKEIVEIVGAKAVVDL